MTDSARASGPSDVNRRAWHADDDALVCYAQGDLDGAVALSLEAHLPDCPTCRRRLGAHLDAARLDRNRALVLVAVSLPPARLVERGLRAVGFSEHLARLISSTPSLRRSWLLATAFVLALALGASYLMTPVGNGHGAPTVFGLPSGSAMRLVPFLIVVPLLPLGGVAAAFSRRLDPMHDLAVAAPMSGVLLFLVRSVAVLATSLIPAAIIAMALPAPVWIGAFLLLPALALSAVALTASTVLDPATAAIGAGVSWALLVSVCAVTLGSPIVVYGPVGQSVAAGVVFGAVLVLFLRRGRLELGWAR